MNSRKMTAAVLAATMIGGLGMSSCRQADNPGSPTSTQSSTAVTNELLGLNDSLREKLGADYSDAWIEGDQLHVAVTTDEAAKIVVEAGAIATLVAFDAAQLEAALQAVMAWRATLSAEQSAAIHTVTTDGRNGTVTMAVDPAQLDAVKAAATQDKPAGNVSLLITESSGLASPLSSQP